MLDLLCYAIRIQSEQLRFGQGKSGALHAHVMGEQIYPPLKTNPSSDVVRATLGTLQIGSDVLVFEGAAPLAEYSRLQHCGVPT